MIGAGEARDVRGRQREEAFEHPERARQAKAYASDEDEDVWIDAESFESGGGRTPSRSQSRSREESGTRSSIPSRTQSQAPSGFPRAAGADPLLSKEQTSGSAPARRSGSAPRAEAAAGAAAQDSAGGPSAPRQSPDADERQILTEHQTPRSEPAPNHRDDSLYDFPTAGTRASSNGLELTEFPSELDAAYARLDADAALHATTISTGGVWTRSTFESLLTRSARVEYVGPTAQAEARAAAFDLLDALSRRCVRCGARESLS